MKVVPNVCFRNLIDLEIRGPALPRAFVACPRSSLPGFAQPARDSSVSEASLSAAQVCQLHCSSEVQR